MTTKHYLAECSRSASRIFLKYIDLANKTDSRNLFDLYMNKAEMYSRIISAINSRALAII